MDSEKNFCQGKPTSAGEKDIFNSIEKSDEVDELMKTVENDTSGVHEQDLNYMDELLSYIGDVNEDGVENNENSNDEDDNELTNLLENNSDSVVDRFATRDIISPMSIDSGIELGSDSGAGAAAKSSNQPGQNYNQRWTFLDPSYSITPSSSPVLRSSTPGFETEYYSTSRSNTPTSHSLSPASSTLRSLPSSSSTSRSNTPTLDSLSRASSTLRSSSSTSRSNTPTLHSLSRASSTSRSNTPTLHSLSRASSTSRSSSSISRSNTPTSSPTFNSKLLQSTTNSCFPVYESIDNLSPSKSNSSPASSNPSSTSANCLPTSSASSISCVNSSKIISDFPPCPSSKSCAVNPNPPEPTSNSRETISNSPISGPNLSTNWRVEIIHKSERGNPYKEREKAYWRKRKREDRNQSVKRRKVLWSYEKPQRSYKKECSSTHYSYEEEDHFDDLYLFSDMVGVNPGEASDCSENSDTYDEDSDDEAAVEVQECSEPQTNNRLLVEEDRFPRSTSNVFLTSNTQDDTNPNHTIDDPPILDDAYDPATLDEPNDSHRNLDDLDKMNTSMTPPSPNPSQCVASNNTNLLCDPNNSPRHSPEGITSRFSPEGNLRLSPEGITSRSSRKRKWPSPSEEIPTVIIPELKLDVEEDLEKSIEKSANSPKLRTLRPRRGVETKEEVFKKPEVAVYPRCLTKRSRNRDRKVKLYEKGKMANEKDEARRLRALQVKLNRDRIKFEGMRRDERLKELEKENEMLREEMEERKAREYEGEKRRCDLEEALEESRKKEEVLNKLLEEAKKREEGLINEVKERQKREEGVGGVGEVGNGGTGKEAVNPQGLWTLAPPRSTVRLSHTLKLILIGFILFWSVSRRYRSLR